MTLAKSTNAGDTFTQATSPGHLIASVPYQFAPLQGPYGIYRPSNVHLRPTATLHAGDRRASGAQNGHLRDAHQEPRIADVVAGLGRPGLFGAVHQPYVETSEDPADHVCEPVSSANSGPLRGFELNSLTYNTYYDKWMAIGWTVKATSRLLLRHLRRSDPLV